MQTAAADRPQRGAQSWRASRNWWPDHEDSPRTVFISERHQAAKMWKL